MESMGRGWARIGDRLGELTFSGSRIDVRIDAEGAPAGAVFDHSVWQAVSP
jgi:hypothetical protein